MFIAWFILYQFQIRYYCETDQIYSRQMMYELHIACSTSVPMYTAVQIHYTTQTYTQLQALMTHLFTIKASSTRRMCWN